MSSSVGEQELVGRMQPADRVVWSQVAGSTVLFHLDDRRLHFLNETAGGVWAAISRRDPLEVIAIELAESFGVAVGRVRGDVEELLTDLSSSGLVVPVPPDDVDLVVARRDPDATRLRPDSEIPCWPETGSYRALDARLRIETFDAELGDVVAGALTPLWSDVPAERAIRIGPDHDNRWTVTARKGEPVVVSDRLAAVMRTLGEVNAAAVESVPDQLVLHAGAVAVGDAAVLLPGGVNHGKSTLTTGLVRAGMRYLTDEAAVITEDRRCRPYPKAIALDPGSFPVHRDLAPPSREGLGALLDSRTWHIDPGHIGEVGGTTPVAAIVFPRWRSGSTTVLTRCPPDEALPALLGNAFEFGTGGQAVFDILCALVSRVPAWRVVYEDNDEAVRAVKDVLAAQP